MNKAAFLNIVRQVAPIEDQEVEDLERLVVTFPYCQTAHVLLAKAAHDRGSMLSNQKLRKAAAHVSNRQLLKKLVYATPVVEETILSEVEEHPATEALVVQPETSVTLGFVAEQTADNYSEDFSTAEIVEDVTASEAYSEVDEPATTNQEDELNTTEPITEVKAEEEPEVILELEAEEEQLQDEPEVVEDEIDISDIAEVKTLLPEEVAEEATISMEDLLQVDLSSSAPVLSIEPTQDSNQPEDTFDAAPYDVLEIEPSTEHGFLVLDKDSSTEIKTEVSSDTISSSEDEELLDLIHIDSLSTLTAPYPSVSLSHDEIISNIITTSETAFYNQEGKVSLEEVMALAAADRELEDLPPLEDELEIAIAPTAEIPEDQLFPWETPGYQIPALKYDLLSQPEPLESIPASADAYTNILSQNSLAYWMDSSRMGESLQLRDELTSSTPFYFQPELILEHVKGNGRPDPEPVPVQNNRLDQQLNIIDQFLKASPKLKSIANSQWKDEPIEDLSAKSSKIKKSLASENLAQIYIKQGKGRKAIKIYEQLIVKYPEKKGYFAEQIEKLRNEP